MPYTDLKIIDELLCDIRQREGIEWRDMERHSSITEVAMLRLRHAYHNGEMMTITLGLANYFKETRRRK